MSKCFDSLWLEECCNDLFEVNIRNDKLAMVYEAGQNNVIEIDTPVGTSEQFIANNKNYVLWTISSTVVWTIL